MDNADAHMCVVFEFDRVPLLENINSATPSIFDKPFPVMQFGI